MEEVCLIHLLFILREYETTLATRSETVERKTGDTTGDSFALVTQVIRFAGIYLKGYHFVSKVYDRVTFSVKNKNKKKGKRG